MSDPIQSAAYAPRAFDANRMWRGHGSDGSGGEGDARVTRHHRGPNPARFAARIMGNVDANGDSSISPDELADALTRVGSKLPAADVMKALDGDGNGAISQSELETAVARLFSRGRAHRGSGHSCCCYDATGKPAEPTPETTAPAPESTVSVSV